MIRLNLQTRICNKCNRERPIKEFYPRKILCHTRDERIAKRSERCRSDIRQRQSRCYANSKGEYFNKFQLRRKKLRSEVLEHYGRSCQCCGEGTIEFLEIDHINGGGAEHRRQIGDGSLSFYLWLKRNGFPEGFQTLCRNCNFAKHAYQGCPHKSEDVMALLGACG